MDLGNTANSTKIKSLLVELFIPLTLILSRFSSRVIVKKSGNLEKESGSPYWI